MVSSRLTVAALQYLRFANCEMFSGVDVENRHFHPRYCDCRSPSGGTPSNISTLNLFSVNIHVHQKPSSAIFREGIRLGLVYRVRVSFR